MKSAIHEATRSQYTVHLLDSIFDKPIFKASDLAQKLSGAHNIHPKTTLGLLRQMKKADILRELQAGSGRRSQILCFPKLINLAEGKTVI